MKQFEKNSFLKGMNKDISKAKRQNDTYIDLKNFRLLTDEGESSGALVNIKGNDFLVVIPDTYDVYEIKIDQSLVGTINAHLTIIDQNGNSLNSTILPVSQNTDIQDIFNSMPTGFSDVNFYQGANSIVITGLNGNISVSSSVGGVYTIVQTVSAQQNLIPIGWYNLRDDIYIFTTNEIIENPTTSAGQIWKLTYNKTSFTPIITLIYNNIVNFTVAHPIVNPGGVTGRYENGIIQRLYWTDNYNSLRKLNVVDPNAFAISPSLLEIQPLANFSVPVLKKVEQAGTLKAGIHQIAYTLESGSGVESVFSQPSNLIHITNSSEVSSYQTYTGSNPGTATNKSIRFTVKGIDTNFERIVLYSIFRENYQDIPQINRFDEIILNGADEIEAVFTGNESLIPVSMSQFQIQSGKFYCKSLANKDNHLFIANIREQRFTVDYDTRAYRFNHNQLAKLYNEQNILTHNIFGYALPPTPNWNIGTDEDVINPYNNENPNHPLNTINGGWDRYHAGTDWKFKADGQTFGGQGPNVEYDFVLTNTEAEVKSINGFTGFPYKGPNVNQYSRTLTNNGQVNIEQTFEHNAFNDMSSPYQSGLLRGYMRGEMYRFYSVFINKAGAESFAYWIADIKMPHNWEIDANGHITHFAPLLETGYSTDVKMTRQLGVKFTFNNLNLLGEDIVAIKIVRVKRDKNNKTILGQSPLFPTVKIWENNNNTHLPALGNLGNDHPCVLSQSCETWVMHSPEFTFDAPPEYQAGDRLKLTEVLHENPDGPSLTGRPVYTENLYAKMYKETQPLVLNSSPAGANPHYTVAATVLLQPATAGALGTELARNFIKNGDPIEINPAASASELYVTAKGLFVKLTSLIANAGANQPSFKRLVGNYMRFRDEQYGGRGFASRQANEAISCSNFIPLKNSTSISIDTYGGDTFVNLMDIFKVIPLVGGAGHHSTAFYFPIETFINTDLRQGEFYNHTALTPGGPFGPLQTQGEEYIYNNVYSSENDVKKYYPQPAVFNEVLEYDNRVWGSKFKINGEIIDSWGIFPFEEVLDVEGEYGPINNIINFNDEIYFFQDRGFGKLSINPKVLVNSTDGDVQTQLGTGTLLDDYSYISTKTGSKHQHGFVVSDHAIYWYDVIGKKVMKLSGEGQTSLSDIKGMNAYFRESLNNQINEVDNPLLGAGLTGTYDYRRHEVWFTFWDREPDLNNIGQFKYTKFTLVYSEPLQAFQGFYGFTPTMYINDKYNIISPNPNSPNKLYLHEKGDYCVFYDNTPEDSYITILINPNADISKVFTNLEWFSEVYNGVNEVFNETISKIRVFNEYQDTGEFTTFAKDLRKWRAGIPRDIVSSANLARIRNPWTKVTFKYNNALNRKLILHDIVTHYSLQPL